MTPHQTPPSVTDEMVRAAGDVLLGRVNAPEQEIYSAAREALTAALAAMPGGVDEEVLAALKHAEKFISNGIELGFIRMPDAGTPDPAHDALPKVRAAIAKAEASRLTPSAIGAEGWRPIESAPKDGTRILAWTPAGHDIVWWSDLEPDGPEEPGHNPGWWGACGETAPGRTPEHGFGGNPTHHWPAQSQPTHWQPLPTPPTAQESK